MFAPGVGHSNITPYPVCRKETEAIGTNRRSTRRVASPDMWEAGAGEAGKWKMDEYSRKGQKECRRLFVGSQNMFIIKMRPFSGECVINQWSGK